MSEVPQAEVDVVTGTVAGVVTEGDSKYIVQVHPDGSSSQFPRRLRTNDQAQASELMAYIGHRLSFQCRISRYNLPDGSPGESRWINGWVSPGDGAGMQTVGQVIPQVMPQQPAAPVATVIPPAPAPTPAQVPAAVMPVAVAPPVPVAPPQPVQVPQAPPSQEFGQPDARELRIMREAADHTAATILAALIERTEIADLAPEKLHGFLDSVARRRIAFYMTGELTLSEADDEIPF